MGQKGLTMDEQESHMQIISCLSEGTVAVVPYIILKIIHEFTICHKTCFHSCVYFFV